MRYANKNRTQIYAGLLAIAVGFQRVHGTYFFAAAFLADVDIPIYLALLVLASPIDRGESRALLKVKPIRPTNNMKL